MVSYSTAMTTNSLISPSITSILPGGAFCRLGILASGSGSNFEAVAQAIKNGQLNAQIQVLIYNNPDAYAAVRAENWDIPAVLLNHRDYKSREDFDAEIVRTLQKYNVEWVVMAGWMRIVTQVLIQAYTDKIINIHPSLLPSFKGASAIEQALASGVKIAGCTVHIVRLQVDDGPILMQAAVPILPDDTTETLHQRIQIEEHRILPAAISLAIKAE
ncbi:phosphoribosylglycinamide formyltransferase [Dulcicalothrix desertica PCC 7102]|uniref:Phosphoribosylglycinamide formyltransferase n=1 Tax=Dulcicalothrix desertica PCC 7102 TaxID=232991 RepID=A0A3S1C5Q9_9CYAN|nr:phosphoribosylglycinamide formyltransferase [Dulcicalothrix desertica]RUT00730.1 phosphoribosylglycinamide formyltransferase [Dulcicalothrix desertica PCC 7102]TWH42424.1 phosphoribosylglycinamide formyltransferase-1 [Dulcicalothrix desertica PCC 7102]